MSKHIYFFSNALDDPTNISRCANIVWCVWFHYSLSIWYSPRGSKNPWGPPGQVEDAVRTMSSCNCRGHGVLGHRLHRLYWQFAFFPRSNGCLGLDPQLPARSLWPHLLENILAVEARVFFLKRESRFSLPIIDHSASRGCELQIECARGWHTPSRPASVGPQRGYHDFLPWIPASLGCVKRICWLVSRNQFLLRNLWNPDCLTRGD